MAFSALAAIAAMTTAATAVGGTVIGSENAAATNAMQQGIARNGTQNALNQQQYQAALNALAMKRATAGTVDGQGNQLTYDPSTNTWRTALSPTGQQQQTAADQAAISRNTTDLATGQRANNNAMADAIKARMAAGPALARIQNYKPLTAQGLEGDLQETATTANRQAEDPIIADTLRQFARTGTAAGPVLTNMMRDNATTLRTTMLNDKVASMKNVGDINNANMAGLDNNYSTLNAASQPRLNFSPIDTNSPSTALTQLMASRANGAAQPASTGAYSSSGATNAFTVANADYAKNYGGSNLGSSILGIGNQLGNLFSPTGAVSKYFSPTPTGNTTGAKDGFGNTIGADQMNPTWQNTQNMFTGTGAP